jgi:hypothetical protein
VPYDAADDEEDIGRRKHCVVGEFQIFGGGISGYREVTALYFQ